MISLFLRNLFFTVLQPGIVAGLIPYMIIRRKMEMIVHPQADVYLLVGGFLFVAGLCIMTACIVSFAVKGKGTLSPADPTKYLVITGLYRYSRNPMYIGVLLILASEAVYFNTFTLWIYFAFIFMAFSLFIAFVEEPRLRKDFGREYELYCIVVR